MRCEACGLFHYEQANACIRCRTELPSRSKADNVNPQHYKKYKLETIDNIQNSMTHEEFIGYLKGNIKKYVDRYRDKGGVEDLKKSRWYLEKLIEVESNETG